MYNNLSFTIDAIVDINIESDSTNVDEGGFSGYQGDGLTKPIDCTVIENTGNYSISLAWKHNNNSVLKFSSGMQPGIYQVKEKNSQRLYINKPALSDGELYSCEFSIENAAMWSKSFTLIFGMLLAVLSVQLHDLVVYQDE